MLWDRIAGPILCEPPVTERDLSVTLPLAMDGADMNIDHFLCVSRSSLSGPAFRGRGSS
jgi:hypothetical protein